MPAARWTAGKVRAMQSEARAWPRYELVDGSLHVTPAPTPRHQGVVLALATSLRSWLEARGIGIVLTSPADLELEPGSVVQPDIFVVRSADGTIPDAWSDIRRLMLAVEVVSPSTARRDRVEKRDYYLRNGVAEYWIVDADARCVERHALGHHETLRDELVWRPGGALASSAFVLDLREFFRQVCK